MKKTTIHIKGMHCRSCELLIEDELCQLKGVKEAKVSHSKGTAEIVYSGAVQYSQLAHAVKKAGYEIGVNEKKPLISKNIDDYAQLLACAFILIVVFLFAKELGIFNIVSLVGGNYSSLLVVFLIGITAGLSTCMAMVGGLVLGVSARFAEKHPLATPVQKFKPHLFFISGRIISYFVLGALIGYVGSLFQLSPIILGLLSIGVGLVMLILGFQLTELFPRLSSVSITLPTVVSKLFGIQQKKEKEYSHTNAFILGGLTFFLPCGFTQAMQLFAISSRSPIIGALTMGVFALGTAPGLLGIAGLTSIIKGTFAKTFFRFAGLVVIGLAFFNMVNGYHLTGISLSAFSPSKTTAQADPNVELQNGVQVVKMTQAFAGYSPNTFTIKKGIPVKWVINSVESRTCAASIVMSAYGIRQGLQKGENIIEFTPTDTGTIPFSCSMGMYTGSFTVVDAS